MAGTGFGWMDRLIFRRSLRRWRNMARAADAMPPDELRRLSTISRGLRGHLDQILFTSSERLSIPVIGSNSFPRPQDSDWAWRPELWRGALSRPGLSSVPTKSRIGSEITLFHDCKLSELTLRQVRNQRETDLAPFGLQMDVFRFDGSFLSLVIDLPNDAARDLKTSHLVRIDATVDLEKPLEIFARLNVKHGPNTEQVVREMPMGGAESMVEFDLGYSKLNEKRVEKAWLDLIFEGPEMNQVVLRDLTFSRRPRAAL